jgi:hypothetical protein
MQTSNKQNETFFFGYFLLYVFKYGIVLCRGISRQRLGKHIPVGTDTHATIEVLCFLLSLCTGVIRQTNGARRGRKYKRLKLGGGQAYDRSSD